MKLPAVVWSGLRRLLARKPANRKRRRALRCELLEGRDVPASPLVSYVLSGTANTVVTGTVYEDLNSNAKRDGGENGVAGWTVYLDLDNSGTLNKDAAGTLEPSRTTNVDGAFTFKNLQPGTYRVSEVLQSGWEATAPASLDVAVVNNKTTTANFFNFSGGGIAGTVWNDLNGDGVRATDPVTGAFTDPGLADWTVFLDANNNRLPDPGEPATVTDAAGGYAFNNLPPGDYEVTEVLPTGWDVSPTFDTRQTAAVAARSVVTQDFANFSLTNGSLAGVIWNDVNVNGVRDTDPATGAFTDPGLADWAVFLDANRNGVADPGEPTALTDADGNYAFNSLAEGDYEVTEVLPANWAVAPGFDPTQTVSVFAGEAAVARDFANFSVLNGGIAGTVWSDVNRNGVRDTTIAGAFKEPGLAGWTVFLDLNRNRVADPGEPTQVTDATGAYAFAGLQIGDYEVVEVVPTGWEVAPTFSDNYTVTVYSGTTSTAPDFANFNLSLAVPGSVSGTLFNDVNGNSLRDAGEPGLTGRTVFLDQNGNGALDAAEPRVVTAADGTYTFANVLPGTVTVVEQGAAGWKFTAPPSGVQTLALRNGENVTGLDFGNQQLKDSTIRGTIYADANKDGVRGAGEHGLAGITVYLDTNGNGTLDAGEPQTVTSDDLFYTPAVDEAGAYSFTHLATGTYAVREILPAALGATPAKEIEHVVTIAGAEDHAGVDSANVFRPNEIHGVKFEDVNANHQRDAGEPGLPGVTIYLDLNRNNLPDAGEPTTITAADGAYAFTNLAPGAYVVREIATAGYSGTFPTTLGGILWPAGVSNPAVGNVSPLSITTSLAVGESYRQTVSLTLPNTGALTNKVDVFLLFDDTGSFVNNSPIVRGAFPTIISQLQASLAGIDLGFGVGRFEEYANFAWEYATGRPFILNQPIVAASTPGYMAAIQAALNRTTPGYGGDQPETDIEALYQLVTGAGFDGNNNGSVLDSGVAGLVSTQLDPGASGDVPSFASFTADASGNVMAAAGNVGGGGFRAGALPIILMATDTGFAYQPDGAATITGVGGLTVPVGDLTQTSRPTTPYNAGAGLQQTITGLNALGALVIGLGTNAQTNVDPRQGLSAISRLTGAVNRSATTIANGTATPIAPGDPLYFEIASGFASSVSAGVVNAIQNAVTNVAVDVTVQASDPRVRIVNHTGVRAGIGSGQTASFDIEFIGDGVPRRFDLQFVRNGTNVVLGSIPVVLGTPIPGDGYEFEDLPEGEIHTEVNFGNHHDAVTAATALTVAVTAGSFAFDGLAHAATATATGAGGAAVAGAFSFTYNGAATPPTSAGVYTVVATFTSADPNYANASGTATLTITAAAPALAVTGGTFAFDGSPHAAAATATGVGGAAVAGTFAFTYSGSATPPTNAGAYAVVATFTSADPNYAGATGAATLTIGTATPTLSVIGGTYTFDGLAHAATATAKGIGGAAVSGTFAFIYHDSNTAPTNAGTYAVVATFTSSDPNYAGATGVATLTIGAATPTVAVTGGTFAFDGLPHAAAATATGVGGAAVAGTFAFTYNGAATVPTAAGVYNVVATFTSADPNYANKAGTATITIGTAAPVGLAAGKTKESNFWHGSSGQALIRAFDGGPAQTLLAAWLSSNFANLYGAGAGANNLVGKTNLDVANLFQALWQANHDSADVEILTTALDVYATTLSLGGAQGKLYGFKVTAAGHGASSYNVGSHGAAVGVANNTRVNVLDLLRAVNRRAKNGVLYAGNAALIDDAMELFNGLNTI